MTKEKITIIFLERGKIYIPEFDDGRRNPVIYYNKPLDSQRLIYIAEDPKYEIYTSDPERLREALRIALKLQKEMEEKERREEERKKWLDGNYGPIFRTLDKLRPIVIYRDSISEVQLRQRFSRPIREGNRIRYRSSEEVQKLVEKEVQRWKRIQESKLAEIGLPEVEEIVVETELAKVRFVPVPIKGIHRRLTGANNPKGSYASPVFVGSSAYEAIAAIQWKVVIEWWKEDENALKRQFVEHAKWKKVEVEDRT